jgi:hypothetical protein
VPGPATTAVQSMAEEEMLFSRMSGEVSSTGV